MKDVIDDSPKLRQLVLAIDENIAQAIAAEQVAWAIRIITSNAKGKRRTRPRGKRLENVLARAYPVDGTIRCFNLQEVIRSWLPKIAALKYLQEQRMADDKRRKKKRRRNKRC
ncbi:MAG: hypothetical protein WC768_01290 [Patescibacteria group bacterium]